MFKRILIANRGEIALRIIRACHQLGVDAVVVYSEMDKDSLPVKLADKALCIGPAPASQSYLQIPSVIAAAKISGCEAIHPGYGFLAENADFARLCAENDLVFIGPSAESIELMGDKARARETMMAAGVPCVPGSQGTVDNVEGAFEVAKLTGYPLLIKAKAGGGGKGMRVVNAPDELEHAYDMARNEALAAFGNSEVYIERYLARSRHVEMQILADTRGNVMHLCERDCSVQRRHQKLIEEAPSPALSQEQRDAMAAAALAAVRGAKYVNAGTIEFLLAEDGSFYFMEMNTRVQVEHPVSEQVTGVDIIKEQLRIASGEPLGCLALAPCTPKCHAMEFRINAEDPAAGFRPCPGRITRFDLPGGRNVRVDTHIRAGSVIPPTYDSLIAKLIVWGDDRAEAIAVAKQALREFKIEGIATTIPFHLAVLENPVFCAGAVFTDFVETQMGGGL
ncbi:MAG: acetyl-CoA carboxylase biotin carboxylase subunit [Coriobacteriales bacterium]|nr:acetyl-CoA carboxylase biotin carboxylase subunit [Coriobacteriales bacterium]MBQ6585246.1 acetyl-CoA carboxylase biotin carboxylase subunit [Coriobacteriales bacterium]